MEKFLKRIRITAVLIIMLLIIAIGFFGIYAKNTGIWSNVLPEYNLGMELGGYRELHFTLDSSEETKDVYIDENGNYKGDVKSEESSSGIVEDTTVQTSPAINLPEGYKIENRTIAKNDPSKINIENFEKAKKIIQKRLEKYELYEYNLRQDSVTGTIILEVPNDEQAELKRALVSTIGTIQFVDSQTGLILLDDSNLVLASPFAMTTEEGEYDVYLQLDFDEEGKKILEKITNEYTPTVAGDGTENTSTVEVRLDDQPIISTHFEEPITSGTVHVPMGEPTADYEEYYQLVEDVQEVCEIINEENLPLYYVIRNDAVLQSEFNDNAKLIALIVYIVLTLIISIYMIVKYKFEGLRQAVTSVAYVAFLTIVFRYANILITYNSIISLVCVIIINYIFALKFLKKLKQSGIRKDALKESLKELYLAIIPFAIVAVIFTFMSATVINSVGTTLFWGLLLQLLFSLITVV